MRIAILTENFLTGGHETNILTYTRFLDKEKIEYIIISSSAKYLSSLYPKSKYRIVKNLSSLDPNDLSKASNAFDKHFESFKPTHIIIHPYITFQSGVTSALRKGIPYSLFFHGPNSIKNAYPKEYQDFFFKNTIPNATNIFCISDEIKTILSQYSNTKKSVILPNPIDYRDIKQRRLKKITIASRLDSDKTFGILTAIDLLESLNISKNYDIQLYGSGDQEKIIAQKLKNLDSHITLMGHQENDVIVKSITESVFAIGMGRVAVESFQAHTPILIAGYDGLKGFIRKSNYKEFAKTNFSGRDITNKSQKYIENEINEMLKDSKEFKIWDEVKSQYDIEVIGNRLLMLLK